MGGERIDFINKLLAEAKALSREGLCGMAQNRASGVLERPEPPQETAEVFLRKFRTQPDFQPGARTQFIRWLKGIWEKRPEEKPLPRREPATAKAPKAEPARYLHVDSMEAWHRIKDAMLAIEPLRQAAGRTEKAEALLKTLSRFEGAAERLFTRPPEEIDENSSEDLAVKIMKVLGDYMSQMLQYLDKSPAGPSVVQMGETMDAYLAALYVERREFRPGANINEWIELNMRGDVIVSQSTDDASKKGKISEIYVQPRIIRYLNAYEEICGQYFLGRCCAYKLNA